MRRSMIGAGIAVACVLAAAGDAGAATAVLDAVAPQSFRTADANVRCRYTPSGSGRRATMRCDAIRTRRGVRVAGRFTPVGRAAIFRPRDAVPAVPARIVRNGNTVAVGAFRCTVSDRVMVCMSIRSPYGFAIGTEQQAPLAGRG